jgi:hypothetical protein
MWLNLITTTLSTTTFILSMIKNIQLITIDCIDWRGEKQYPEGRNNKEKEK